MARSYPRSALRAEHDVDARLDLSARAVPPVKVGKPADDFAKKRGDLAAGVRGEILFGIIHVRVDACKAGGEHRLILSALLREGFGVQRIARADMGGGFRFDHLPHPLDGGEGQFAVEKGAAGKFPALRGTGAELYCARKDAAGDLRPPVAMKFHHVLARKGLGRAKENSKAVVFEIPAVDLPGIHFIRLEGLARKHLFRKLFRPVPADADDGDSPLPGRRCDRGYEFHILLP